MSSWRKYLHFFRQPPWPTLIGLFGVIGISLAVRLSQPINDPSIGEIDVYFWALRTQEFLLYGWSQIGTSLWVTPVVMGALHTVFGGSLYDTFLWGGSFITAIGTPIGIYFLTKEISSSRAAGLFGALAIAISPVILYRSVFTVSETLAYVLIPWTLFFAVRLVTKKSIPSFVSLAVLVLIGMQTHDSAKLLVLPAAAAIGIFFWETRRRRSTWVLTGLSLAGGIGLMLYDPTIWAGIKFFLWPTNTGNSAFGDYPPVLLSEYLNVSALAFSAFTLAGITFWILMVRRHRRLAGLLALFIVPVIFYQQIQPRISDSTIVSFRLTPFLAFVAAPLLGVVLSGWARVVQRISYGGRAVIFISSVLLLGQFGVADFPLSYITAVEEQKSLTRLPITRADYLITQTSMIGMTSVATKTNEANYFGDLADQVLGAQTSSDVLTRLRNFIAQNPSRPTGVLISKWKLANRDPKFGWWDSLVNPTIKLGAWRSSGLPIRFEDNNIIIFDVPERV